jgi:hypothetical protein
MRNGDRHRRTPAEWLAGEVKYQRTMWQRKVRRARTRMQRATDPIVVAERANQGARLRRNVAKLVANVTGPFALVMLYGAAKAAVVGSYPAGTVGASLAVSAVAGVICIGTWWAAENAMVGRVHYGYVRRAVARTEPAEWPERAWRVVLTHQPVTMPEEFTLFVRRDVALDAACSEGLARLSQCGMDAEQLRLLRQMADDYDGPLSDLIGVIDVL